MPKLEFRSNAPPSKFGYPAPLEEKKREEREKVTTAVLSITARAKRKGAAAQRSSDAMEVDEVKEKEKEEEKEKEKKEKEKKDEEKKPEPNFEILQNPARVMKQQLKCVQFIDQSTYVPLKDVSIGGIVMVRHLKSGEEEELVEPVAAFGPKSDDEKEPDPPEAFEYFDE